MYNANMSELQLSAQLVSQVQDVVIQHDEAAQDPGVASQYLCALVGFLLGQQDMPSERKTELQEQLSAFMLHVMQDVDKQRQQAKPAPPPVSPQDAFGIWKPGNS